MNPKVIEAAAMAILTEFGEVPYYRDMAESAIRAADAARAEDVTAAVDRFETTVAASVAAPSSGRRDARAAARRELLALLGIPEDGA